MHLLWIYGWLGLAIAQTAPSAPPTYGSGVSTECVKQSDNPCPRPYFYDFTPVGNFAFFSCGSDGYARCGYNPVTAAIVPGSCSLQSSPCGMEARAAPTYDFSLALSKYAYFSCDIDYYRCAYDFNYGTVSNCVKRISPCPFSVEAFYAIGNAGFFACGADGYYQCVYDESTGVVDLGTCVQKAAPCSVTHDVSVTVPYAYFSCGEGGIYKCDFDPTANRISTTSCTRASSPCGGIVKRTYSFITQANWAFFDCYNDGYYKCKYNSPPSWTTTGPCVVTANCVTSSNFPADYSPGETCIITPLFPQIVHFDDFSTENGYDILVVNNIPYQGRNKPPDQNVSTPIRWNSDASIVSSGWKFCGTPSSPQAPTVSPLPTPAGNPPTSAVPTAAPTLFPSTASALPTVAPSALPTVAPSALPTATPSLAPSSEPSRAPSSAPSLAPSAAPSNAPSLAPSTAKPTSNPTLEPTLVPTPAPTSTPSRAPTASPVTKVPTTRAPTPVPGDTAGTVISVLLIVGLCALLAFFAFLWWRKSRQAAISVVPDDIPPPSPRRPRVREVVSDKPLYGPPQPAEARPDDRRESSTIEML